MSSLNLSVSIEIA